MAGRANCLDGAASSRGLPPWLAQVMNSPLWHSRAAGCNFLQFLVFSNLFTMQSCDRWREAVVGHTLALLRDPRLEVGGHLRQFPT